MIPSKVAKMIEEVVQEEIKRKEDKIDSDNLGGLVWGGKTSKQDLDRKPSTKKVVAKSARF